MVNKDVGAERWTINVNLFSTNPDDISNVSGNVFKSDGSPPSFVLCQVRPESEGSLADESSELHFRCRGTGPCTTAAQRCARSDWGPIPGADDIALPVSFFLPPGGLGTPAGTAARAVRPLHPLAADRPSQASDRGATLSFDTLNLLVNKDVGGERWSISLNFVPELDDDGLVRRRLVSITGNVIRPGGSAPAFLYCTVRDDSTGTLEDPSSEFRFSCQAMDACQGSAEECATSAWQLIAEDVPLPASFFLPPDGLTGVAQSDPDLIVLGRTSGPPAIVADDFELAEGVQRAPDGGVSGDGSCPVGAACAVAQVGVCVRVNGTVVETEGGGCGCRLDQIAGSCLFCNSGTCGESCEFPVGGSTARGVCLPYAAGSRACVCHALPAGVELPTVGSCNGPLGAECPSGSCCADDPLDGCDAASGDFDCAGVCVEADCPAGASSCGICDPSSSVCGNGEREDGEDCDGAAFGPLDCTDFGFFGGDLACDDECRVDTSSCGPTVTPAPCKTGTCQ
jgi:hypothetical protein